jgi:hypothetical protein
MPKLNATQAASRRSDEAYRHVIHGEMASIGVVPGQRATGVVN